MTDSPESGPEPPIVPVFCLRRRWWPWAALGVGLFALALGFPAAVDALPGLLVPLTEAIPQGARTGFSVVAVGGVLLCLLVGAMIWSEAIRVGPDGIEDQRRWSGGRGPVPWDQIRQITYRTRPRQQLEVRLPDSRLYITDRFQPFDRLVTALRAQAELYEIPWRDL